GAGEAANPALTGAISLALALLQAGCASLPKSSAESAGSAPGVRALDQVRAAGPRGAEKLRLAAALRPPGSARLEFLGPLGGPRLIVPTDGRPATAVLPAARPAPPVSPGGGQSDVAPARPASMRRLLALPIDGERLIALLSGKPPCG